MATLGPNIGSSFVAADTIGNYNQFGPGFEHPTLDTISESFVTYKRPIPLSYALARTDRVVTTLEGRVHCLAGDAIMTGTHGERWPIPRAVFDETYEVVGEGIAHKKRMNIRAVEMPHDFDVKVSWAKDMLHGRCGDFLVEYNPDHQDYGVVERSIFAETYERYRM